MVREHHAMNYSRIALAALGAMVAYFVLGGVFFMNPAMKAEFMKYSTIYRSQDDMKGVMPFGMLGMLLSMVVLAILFAMIHPAGAGVMEGAQFGVLVALYALGSVVLHNYVNLRIGARLTVFQAVAYSVEWI